MPVAAIFGSSMASPGDQACLLAADLAAGLARMGFTLKTGGYAGVMEAASRAAREAGGSVIGVTLMDETAGRQPNRWLTGEIREADLLDRLRALVSGTDIFFAIERGGPGTLNEVFLVWAMRLLGELPGPPIVLVGPGWSPVLECLRDHLVLHDEALDALVVAPTAADALAIASRIPAG